LSLARKTPIDKHLTLAILPLRDDPPLEPHNRYRIRHRRWHYIPAPCSVNANLAAGPWRTIFMVGLIPHENGQKTKLHQASTLAIREV
jgi:hypothetical protein